MNVNKFTDDLYFYRKRLILHSGFRESLVFIFYQQKTGTIFSKY
jgi:hypothetical protein